MQFRDNRGLKQDRDLHARGARVLREDDLAARADTGVKWEHHNCHVWYIIVRVFQSAPPRDRKTRRPPPSLHPSACLTSIFDCEHSRRSRPVASRAKFIVRFTADRKTSTIHGKSVGK